jgi:hypothetical protein
MKKIKEIIIEKGNVSEKTKIDIDGMDISSNRILFTHNHNYHNVLGIPSYIKKTPEGIICGFIPNKKYDNLFPSVRISIIEKEEKNNIYYIKKCKLLSIGLCDSPNADKTIKAIQK